MYDLYGLLDDLIEQLGGVTPSATSTVSAAISAHLLSLEGLVSREEVEELARHNDQLSSNALNISSPGTSVLWLPPPATCHLRFYLELTSVINPMLLSALHRANGRGGANAVSRFVAARSALNEIRENAENYLANLTTVSASAPPSPFSPMAKLRPARAHHLLGPAFGGHTFPSSSSSSVGMGSTSHLGQHSPLYSGSVAAVSPATPRSFLSMSPSPEASSLCSSLPTSPASSVFGTMRRPSVFPRYIRSLPRAVGARILAELTTWRDIKNAVWAFRWAKAARRMASVTICDTKPGHAVDVSAIYSLAPRIVRLTVDAPLRDDTRPRAKFRHLVHVTLDQHDASVWDRHSTKATLDALGGMTIDTLAVLHAPSSTVELCRKRMNDVTTSLAFIVDGSDGEQRETASVRFASATGRVQTLTGVPMLAVQHIFHRSIFDTLTRLTVSNVLPASVIPTLFWWSPRSMEVLEIVLSPLSPSVESGTGTGTDSESASLLAFSGNGWSRLGRLRSILLTTAHPFADGSPKRPSTPVLVEAAQLYRFMQRATGRDNVRIDLKGVAVPFDKTWSPKLRK